HGRRTMVHLRPHASTAAGGLPGDADSVHRVHAETERLLHGKPGERRGARRKEGCGEGSVLSRVMRTRAWLTAIQAHFPHPCDRGTDKSLQYRASAECGWSQQLCRVGNRN